MSAAAGPPSTLPPIGALQQDVVVTASAVRAGLSQIGARAVVCHDTLDALAKPDILRGASHHPRR
jgi:hypothetical protein